MFVVRGRGFFHQALFASQDIKVIDLFLPPNPVFSANGERVGTSCAELGFGFVATEGVY